jgi:hypothetical protein
VDSVGGEGDLGLTTGDQSSWEGGKEIVGQAQVEGLASSRDGTVSSLFLEEEGKLVWKQKVEWLFAYSCSFLSK